MPLVYAEVIFAADSIFAAGTPIGMVASQPAKDVL